MKGLYLRVGEWGEKSYNHALGSVEAGVSVYDLVGARPVVSEDASDSHFAEMDLADRLASDEPKYLVRGELVGVGHDGEPLLANVVKVAEVEICPDCGGLEVRSVEGLHLSHVGLPMYPVFRYPVPSVQHGLVAMRVVTGIDLQHDVLTSVEMAPFAAEVAAAYWAHREANARVWEKDLNIGQRLERQDGEGWVEWRHRHAHGEVEVAELEAVATPGGGHQGLHLLAMS